MTLVVVPAALLVGLLLGTLGGGGAILTVPALVHLVGQTPHEATTSSLVIVGVTSLLALGPHHRRGHVLVGSGLAFGAAGSAGAVGGSALSAGLPDRVLLLLFAGLVLVVAVVMARRALRPEEPADDGTGDLPLLTVRPFTCACPRLARVIVTASVVGFLTGLLGVGGGFVLVPALVLALGLSTPDAVGTSLLVVVVNSVTGLAGRVALSDNVVHWPVVGAFTAVAVVGSVLGARLADRIPARTRTAAFAVLLVVVGVGTGIGALA